MRLVLSILIQLQVILLVDAIMNTRYEWSIVFAVSIGIAGWLYSGQDEKRKRKNDEVQK